MGPPLLSALMARLLRSQLITQLDELEPSLAKRRAALGRWGAPCIRQVVPVCACARVLETVGAQACRAHLFMSRTSDGSTVREQRVRLQY